MIIVTPEEISQFRSQLADNPQALVALDTIEECEGYLDDAVPLLVMRETAQEAIWRSHLLFRQSHLSIWRSQL
ncbi:MAG: hypothetical protein V7K92_20615 [Nostoc sp.]|uniref:hypothetical protein n=2 Tax=Nostoc sp. TaxID=1180 RepID=UPI002FF20F4A